jgi:hypothetical protein
MREGPHEALARVVKGFFRWYVGVGLRRENDYFLLLRFFL